MEMDLNDININAVTTKKECVQLLRESGIWNFIAEVLRDIYETNASEWPEDASHFLLTQLLHRIPIVKQMRVMQKNIKKRLVEMEIEMERKEEEKLTTLKHARRKSILALQKLQKLNKTFYRHHDDEVLKPQESLISSDAEEDTDSLESFASAIELTPAPSEPLNMYTNQQLSK